MSLDMSVANILVLLIVWCATNDVSTWAIPTIHIATPGDISPTSSASLPFIAPGLNTALEELRKTYSGIFNFNQTYIYDRTITNYADMYMHTDDMVARWYYKQQSDAAITIFIFTGGDEVKNINRLAAGWNSLMISSAATSPTQRNKQISPTWLAMGCCTALNFAKPVVHLLTENNWTSVYLVVDEVTIMARVVAEAVQKAVQRIEHTQYTIFTIPFTGRNSGTYEKILREFNASSRVLFYFGHSDILREFMLQAARLQLLSEDYVYVTVQPFRNTFMFGNLTWNFNDSYDMVAKEAYKSLLVVTTADYISRPGPFAQTQIAEWKHRSFVEYGYSYRLKEQMSPHVVGIYYTMLLFARVLNDTMASKPNLDLRDGALLARQFFNRSIIVDGVPIFIDELGERRSDMVVKQFNNETGIFEVFLAQSGATLEVTLQSEVNWHGSTRFPPNEPWCGFSGLKTRCASQVVSAVTPDIVIGIAAAATIIVIASAILCRNQMTDSSRYWLSTNDVVLTSVNT